MNIKNIYVENFRNLENQSLKFTDGVNVLYGLNGQGKTNIIEAVYYFCNGKSFRALKDKEVVKFGEEKSRIKIEFDAFGRENKGEIYIFDKKNIKLNDIPIKKLSEILGFLNIVIFTPEHLNLIKSGPNERRKFLDTFISQLKPVYFKTLVDYYKVIKQKNIILKSNDKLMIETLDIWDEKLSEYGTQIYKYRKYFLEKLSDYLSVIQADITEKKEDIKINFVTSVKGDYLDKENFLNQLIKNRQRELEYKMALIGPHRDDFEFLINEKNLKLYGSQGQQRTAVLAVKMAECEIIKEIKNEYPVLLLDDIMSELDINRRKYLLEKIKNFQVIITCTNSDSVQADNMKVYRINKGKAICETN